MRFPPPPIPLDSKIVTFVIPKGKNRCTERFPLCKKIRCKNSAEHNGVCHATNRSPYYSIFWEADRNRKKE